MADVVLGCDSNNGDDSRFLEGVKNVLESAGHKVKTLGINPGDFANYSYSSEANGKIGVYLMAASLVSFLDAASANFSLNVFGIRGDVTSWGTEDGFKTKGVPKDHHGDCTIPECDKYQDKTYPELNEIYKGKCVAVPGETPEQLGQNVLSAINGEGFTGSSNQSNSGDEEEEDEDWGDDDNFTPHKGKIMEIKPYKEISSISFDKSYDSPTGTGTVEMVYSSKDYRFVYKGVAMKLKLRRSCDKEWSATGLEEPDYDENEKFFKEHIPTDELLKELGLPNYRKQKPVGSATSTTGSEMSGTDVSGSDSSNGGLSSVGSTMSSVSSSISGGNSYNRSGVSYSVKRASSSGGKRTLSSAYINTLSPSHAQTLAMRTGEFDTQTIKKLRRRAIGLYW